MRRLILVGRAILIADELPDFSAASITITGRGNSLDVSLLIYDYEHVLRLHMNDLAEVTWWNIAAMAAVSTGASGWSVRLELTRAKTPT